MQQVLKKTFTIANVITKNKTLAGQLYSEFKELFPNNRAEYFVSYYSDTTKDLIFKDI